MDSAFNDIEFLMASMKREPANSNVNAEPLAEGGHNNETDQLAMSDAFMTDYILDYILKDEVEETQPETGETDRANEDESVEDLIERAESMIRENERQSIPETSTAATHNEWLQHLNSQLGIREDNNPTTSEQSITPPANLSHPGTSNRPVQIEVPDVISVDTDSDDEVIFVKTHTPPTIPVIDLSDHPETIDVSAQSSPRRHESRKRANNRQDDYVDLPPPVRVPPEKSPDKQFRHSCAICLEDVKAPHSTTCGHIYCGDCIKNALKIFKKCPSCNKKLKISNVHPIYL